jgi:hypothetical protein
MRAARSEDFDNLVDNGFADYVYDDDDPYGCGCGVARSSDDDNASLANSN